MPSGVLTVSATYGAAGSVVAPRLADELGLPFLDRTVSSTTAMAAGAPSESPSEEERAESPPSRWLASLAQLAVSVPGVPTADLGVMGSIGALRAEASDEVFAAAASGGAVILGRAAAIVLGEHRAAFHVRLDGPMEARVARAAEIERISAGEARRRCEATDRMRALYVKRLYGRDAADPRLYHLAIDTTVLPLDVVVALIRDAAEAFWRRSDEDAPRT